MSCSTRNERVANVFIFKCCSKTELKYQTWLEFVNTYWTWSHSLSEEGWPGVARFPILLKSVQAKSKLYELSAVSFPLSRLSFRVSLVSVGCRAVDHRGPLMFPFDGKEAVTFSCGTPSSTTYAFFDHRRSETSGVELSAGAFFFSLDQKFRIYIRLIWQLLREILEQWCIYMYVYSVRLYSEAIFRPNAIWIWYWSIVTRANPAMVLSRIFFGEI